MFLLIKADNAVQVSAKLRQQQAQVLSCSDAADDSPCHGASPEVCTQIAQLSCYPLWISLSYSPFFLHPHAC